MKDRNLVFAILMVVACVLVCGSLLILVDLFFGTEILVPTTVLPNTGDTYLVEARSRISLGAKREQALRALSDAWHHSECGYPDGSFDDLFFYGPRDPDEVEIILLRSRLKNGTPSVHFVGLVENYMLHLYERCDPPPMTVFSIP